MPLNEASARPSNLTRRERHEALAAIYGIPSELTEFDAEELRDKLSPSPSTTDPPPTED